MSALTSRKLPNLPPALDKTGNEKLMSQYMFVVGLIGIGIIAWAIVQQPWQADMGLLTRLAIMAGLAQFASTVTRHTKITFSVAEVAGLVAAVLTNVSMGILVLVLASSSLWLINKLRKNAWKGSWKQLLFNICVQVISVVCATLAFNYVSMMTEGQGVFHHFLRWGIAAIVLDQVNFILVALIIRFQTGNSLRGFWRNHRWAFPINIVLNGVGGNLLVFAISMLGYRGIELFVLPLFLTAYSYRLYVRNSEAQAALLDEKQAKLQELIDSLPETIRREELQSADIFKELFTPAKTDSLNT